MTEQHFPLEHPVQLIVELEKGAIEVTAHETDTAEVLVEGRRADEVRVDLDGDRLSVIGPHHGGGIFGGDDKLRVTVRVPADSALQVRTGSADLTAHGRWADTRVKTGSGDVVIESIADGDLQTGSGDVRLELATGDVTVKSGSGDLVAARVDGALGVTTGSGDVVIATCGGALTAKTGSGDVKVAASGTEVTMATGSGDLEVTTAARGRVTVRGASGDIKVGVPAGVPVWTDIRSVSGHVDSRLQPTGAPAEGQDHVELRLSTVSGDVTLLER